MLKIRLSRLGTKQRPFYRVVVIDERSKRSGVYIELLGTYNPLTTPHDIKLKQDRIDHWVKMGAQMSDGFLRIIGKAPQKPPRKPKKAKKDTGNSGQPAEAPKAEETQSTEAEDTIEIPADVPAEATQETPAKEVPSNQESTKKQDVVDDSAEKPESQNSDTSESVQK